MKKTKIKMLTTAACLALIGSASAAWVYSGTATASANIGVKVAAYASASTVTCTGYDKINVVLDKDEVRFEKLDGFEKLSAKHNVPSGVDTSNKTVTKHFTIGIRPELYEYITFEGTKDTDYFVYPDLNNLQLSNSINWTDDVDFFNSLPTLKWKDNACPQNENDYQALINKIDSTITWDDWSSSQNNTWNATELNASWFIQLNFLVWVE